ncbi:MAG: UDP-N-acetylmuramoyl-L-alanine--D-glutamate ligase [Alphaproteobacteria bacterium]|nr:UDP-N-acetylmuramoyl-L-alanine--D-glutamate ligase [Alphaproteobacteria bacterium]
MIGCPHMAGQAVAVMGLGKSGLPTARALMASGARVSAWDDDAARREEAKAAGIPVVDLRNCDWSRLATLVLSPGIPHTDPKPHAVAAQARAAGVPIIGDIELLYRARPDAAYVGITGTNGKSTTTALIGHVFRQAGRDVEVGGNIGAAALSLRALDADGSYVLEMSSYQLELVDRTSFDVAVLLNITPDHLDRHGGMDGYVAAKRRIFRGQDAADAAVIGVDDDHCRRIHDEMKRRRGPAVLPISSEIVVKGGVYAPEGVLIDDLEGAARPALDLREVPTLPGRHNWQNAAAAYAAARAAGIAPQAIAAGIRSYPGLAHRQELVGTVEGVRFVNDSKATNADAAAKALACYDAIYWIAGGKPKEGPLGAIHPHLAHVRRAFLIGEAAPRFARELEGLVALEQCGELANATRRAFAAALADRARDPVVLLSPACASFDQFANFEARGEAFRALVADLAGQRRAMQ